MNKVHADWSGNHWRLVRRESSFVCALFFLGPSLADDAHTRVRMSDLQSDRGWTGVIYSSSRLLRFSDSVTLNNRPIRVPVARASHYAILYQSPIQATQVNFHISRFAAVARVTVKLRHHSVITTGKRRHRHKALTQRPTLAGNKIKTESERVGA
ncbi:hypothetical protein BGY98DRAFT_976868 [Russula aff. rugulosa BPL654]|nr:hypothetical protein BGY98DRAFT_976868 [Russula aff. rugulosa BPL654]